MCIIARSYLSSPSVYFKLSTLDLSVRLRVTTGGFVNGKLYVKRGVVVGRVSVRRFNANNLLRE